MDKKEATLRIEQIEKEMIELKKVIYKEEEPNQNLMYVFVDNDGQPFMGYRESDDKWYTPSFCSNSSKWNNVDTLEKLIESFSRMGRTHKSFTNSKDALDYFYDTYTLYYEVK